jgi:hypothetical protein
VWEELDGEAVVLDEVSGGLHRLDPTATKIWQGLDGTQPIESLVTQLASAYSAPADRVRRDVDRLLDQLADSGLLENDTDLPPTDRSEPDDPQAGTPASGTPEVDRTPGDGLGDRADSRADSDWHRSGPYQAVGWRFAVRCSRAVVGDQVARALASLRADGETPGEAYEISSPTADRRGELRLAGQLIVSSRSEQRLYATLLWHVNRGVVEHSRDHVLLHASAAERDGAVVVMSAPMEAGKTTLVAGLILAGMRYLTDETVAVRPGDLGVTPYPKALSVDRGSWQVLPELRPELPAEAEHLRGEQWQVTPRQIRADVLAPGGTPRMVVLPAYVAGAPTRLLPVPRAEALLALLQQRFAPERDPGRDLEVLARMLRSCVCYRLESGDLGTAVEAITAAFDDAVTAANSST